MKKIVLFLIILFSITCVVYAADEREIVSNLEATSNIEEVPVYLDPISAPTFEVTGGIAEFDTSKGGWYRYENDTWIKRTNGYLFGPGRWQYRVQLTIDGENGKLYKFNNQTKVKVNGVNWFFSYSNALSGDDYSGGTVYSPEYNIEATDELEFILHENYVVYRTFVDNPAYTVDVSNGVYGGVEPYVFTKVSGPSWLSVSEDGKINGTPTTTGENENIVVRVTDAQSNYKEISVPVEKTVLPPNLRELIAKIEATSNTDSIPVLGEEIVNPTFNMTLGAPAHFAQYAGGWYKLVGSTWKKMTGTFTPGKWEYRTEIMLDGDEGIDYRLSDETVVEIDGEDWHFVMSGNGTDFFSGNINSKTYTVMGKINSIELTGEFNKPKIGANIEEVYLGFYSINGDNSLVNIADVEAVWQYKTGEGMFDWEDATGKFEKGKTYHIRLMITVTSDAYELENIATFPVTFKGYTLTQFQLNDKTVGEFIEFPELKEFVAPTVAIKNDNNKVILSWDSQPDAVKYKVYKSTDGKKYTKVTDVTENSYTEKGLTYNKTYYYKVKACSKELCTSYSNVVSKKIKPNKTTVTIVGAGTNNIKLSWDRVKVNGYQIARSTDNKKWTTIKTITKNTILEYNNKSLKANKTYYYKVRAYKIVSGKKIYGSWSAVAYTKTAPVKPTLEVKLKDFDSMKLVIGEVKGASEYRVYRSLDNKNWERIATLTVAGTLADASHEVGKTYYYKVKACNKYGYCSSYRRADLLQTTKTPKLTLASTTAKKVTITVGEVNGADGYKIYRATSKNGKYELVRDIKDSLLTFNDKTKSGYTYYYKVRSYKYVDGSKVHSPYSGVKYIKSK